jgi:hypothetical protein
MLRVIGNYRKISDIKRDLAKTGHRDVDSVAFIRIFHRCEKMHFDIIAYYQALGANGIFFVIYRYVECSLLCKNYLVSIMNVLGIKVSNEGLRIL